jgi:hypothetical protein
LNRRQDTYDGIEYIWIVGIYAFSFIAVFAKLICRYLSFGPLAAALTHVGAFFFVPGVLLALGAVTHQWNNRPPSATCSKNGIGFEMAEARFRLPLLAMFKLHDGKRGVEDWLGNSAIVRKVCSSTDEGTKTYEASSLGILLRHSNSLFDLCRAPPDWARELCASLTGERRSPAGLQSVMGWPKEITLERRGERPGQPWAEQVVSTYNERNTPKSYRFTALVSSTVTTPDGSPLTALCTTSTCDVAYPWRDDLVLRYRSDEFNRTIDMKSMEEMDGKVRRLLEGLMRQQ